MSYENTSVTVEKSQSDIRKVLRKYSADSITFGERIDADDVTHIGVEFTYNETRVRLTAQIPPPDPKVIVSRSQRARTKTAGQIREELQEQEMKRLWRVLHWSIKVRMESIEEGLETFEQSFLPHIVDPASGRTVFDVISPALNAGALRLGGNGLKELTA